MNAQQHKEKAGERSNKEETGNNARILVVDDNENNLALLREGLEPEGYQVSTAADGFEGYKKALRERPDLVLLDIMMPQIDGYKVCMQLKKNPDTRDIPVIFITALEKTGDIVRGFEVGGVDYITKPVIMEEVRARVATHLKIKKLERDKLNSLEEKMRAEHWEAVKAMSEGIAHNFNNLLCSAIGNTEFILNIANDGDIKEAGNDILSMLRRTETLVKHLQYLQEMNQETYQNRVDEIIAEVCKKLFENEEDPPEIHTDVSPGLPQLSPGCGTYLKRAILAVMENAWEAVAGTKGEISVSARTVSDNDTQKIEINITDNGKGLDEETRIRAFLPFFSTKHTVGAGLGLYVASMALAKLQGDIEIYPREQAGTTVKMWIPVSG